MAADSFTRELFDWIDRVARDRELGALAKVVVMTLVSHMNRETRDAWPSQRTLADILGVTDRSVERSIKELQDRAHLFVDRAGARQVNRYRIGPGPDTDVGRESPDTRQECRPPHPTQMSDHLVPTADTDVGSPSPHPTQMSGRDVPHPTPVSDDTRHGCRPNHLNEPSENRISRNSKLEEGSAAPAGGRRKRTSQAPTEAEISEFEEFWATYPRKEVRPRALKAFVEARRSGVTAAALVEGARRQARAKVEHKFIPHPATWLSDRRWEDADRQARAAAAVHGRACATGF